MSFKSTLLVTALLAAFSSPAFADTAPEARTETAVRVVTANLRVPVASDYKTGNGWNQRRELCRDVLAAQDADLLCFQECRQVQLDFIEKKLSGYEHIALYNSPREGMPPEPTIAILYSTKRFKKTRSGGFWLSDTPDKPGSRFTGSASARLSNWVLLRDLKTGRDLLVWNTHLNESGGAEGNAVREKQIAVLLAYVSKAPAGTPQIMTGDFNTDAASKTVQSVKAAGWVDTYTAIHGDSDPGPSFHGFRGAKYSGRSQERIDFIFCSGPFRPVAAKIIKDGRDGRYPSDHYFVSADLDYEALSPAAPKDSEQSTPTAKIVPNP
jgi:endonuclease/exonuclease/phosphatase family metal-dependent hydrolase